MLMNSRARMKKIAVLMLTSSLESIAVKDIASATVESPKFPMNVFRR